MLKASIIIIKQRFERQKKNSIMNLDRSVQLNLLTKNLLCLKTGNSNKTSNLNRLNFYSLSNCALLNCHQARILSHKKEQLAEEVQQKKEEAASLKNELQEKRNELKEMGGNVLKGDEVEVVNISKIVTYSYYTTF